MTSPNGEHAGYLSFYYYCGRINQCVRAMKKFLAPQIKWSELINDDLDNVCHAECKLEIKGFKNLVLIC